MNLFIATYPGLVHLLKQEILYLYPQIQFAEEGDSWVIAKTTLQEGFSLLYHLHLALRAFFLLGKVTDNNREAISSLFAALPFKKKTFSFRLLGKKELEERYGGIVLEALKQHFNVSVDLEYPELVIAVEETSQGVFFGIESLHDLAKRDYRIYSSPGSIKAPLAFAMTFFAPEAKVIVDPFVKDGVVLIERALWHLKPLRQYQQQQLQDSLLGRYPFLEKQPLALPKLYGFAEQFSDLRKAKANAKLAQVHKAITFSKNELSWLDYKFDKHSIDLLVGLPPLVSKHHPIQQVQETYYELFYQAAYVLHPKGKIVLWVNERTLALLDRFIAERITYPFQEFSLVLIEKEHLKHLDEKTDEE